MKIDRPVVKLLLEILLSRPWMRVLIFVCSCISALFGILGPFFQKDFIDMLTESPLILGKLFPVLDQVVPHHPLPYLLLSFASVLLSLGFAALVNYLGAHEAIFMQRVLSERLYNKALELRSDSMNGKTVGEIVSLYTTDIPGSTILLEQSLPQAAGIIFPIILAPIALMTLFEIRASEMLSALGAIALLNLFLAYRQSVFFNLFKKLAADRIGVVAEWIQNMRTLRILGWIRAFEQRIFQLRKIETRNRIQMLNNGQTMNAIASSITFFFNVAAIALVVQTSPRQLTSGTVLALLWIVGIFLVRPFRQMPWLFMFVIDAWTSIKRVHTLLRLTNLNGTERDKSFRKLMEINPEDHALSVENLNLTIDGNHILKNIDFSVGRGEFIAIVGKVGSGKSMLLLSLLGETRASFRKFQIGQNDAKKLNLSQLRQFFTYVPQEGFIMSASLRENVACDYEIGNLNDELISRSLARAQFELRLERLTEGLSTEIGERGVNLSGGQKQRISLARVDFFRSPIVVLDDCLSAVDVDTEKKILESLFKNSWKQRTRILVTHRLSVLNDVDRVIYLENGRVVAEGKYKDLLKKSESFREYAQSVARDSSQPQERGHA